MKPALLVLPALVALVGCTKAGGPTTCHVRIVDWHTNETATSADLDGVGISGGKGYAAGAAGALEYTDDGGETWQAVTAPTSADLHAVVHRGPGDAWIAADDGLWHVTGDSATPTIEQVDLGTSATLRALSFAGTAGVAAGDDVVAWTTDGGANWQTAAVGGGFTGAWAVDGERMYASGDDGVIVKLQGGLWTALDAGTTADLHGVAFYEDTGIVVGDGGLVLTTTDGGGAWTAATAPPTSDLHVAVASLDDFFATGPDGDIWRSEDLGQHWVDVFESGVALRAITVFEDNSMPNTQLAAAGAGGQVVVYGSRYEDVVDTAVGIGGACPDTGL